MDSILGVIQGAVNPALNFVRDFSRDVGAGNVLGSILDVARPALAIAGLPEVGGFVGNAIGSAGQFGDIAGTVAAPSSAAGFAGNAIGSAGQFGAEAAGIGSAVSDIIPNLLSSGGVADVIGAALPTASGAGGALPDIAGSIASQLPSQTVVDKFATDFFGGPTGAAAGAVPGTDSGILDFLTRNKDWLVPTGLIGGQVLSPKLSSLLSTKIPGQGALKSLAGQAGNTSAALTPSLATGKLPPGAETFVSNQVNDAVTAIKSRYASMGLSGSTMEQQDINRAQQDAAALRFQLANQATQTGLAALGDAGNMYQALAETQLGEDQASQDAISRLLSALALAQGLSGDTA